MELVHNREMETLTRLLDQWKTIGIESTGATVVNYSGTLYNVEGSTSDPHIGGETWKQLLISHGINGNCYVTSPLPTTTGTSHPGFNVGGHMTPNSSGDVATGGTCYLMPLCSWHNSTARDGQAFSHTETEMLQLSGYMQGEIAVSFVARLPSDKPYSIIYLSSGRWHTENLSESQVQSLRSEGFSVDTLGVEMDGHILLKRNILNGGSVLSLEDIRLIE